MSIDIRLSHPCPHVVIEEPVLLASDRRTLPTSCPVASVNAVRVLVNDSVFVPSTGLYEQATLVATASGPYRVAACDRSLTVTVSTESVTVALTPGADGLVRAESIARSLVTALSSVSVGVDSGRLSITDQGSVGPASFVRVSGPGAASVGFSVQRGCTGSLVYPGWFINGSPTSIIGRYPMFNEPLRGNPSIKVSYSTFPQRCRRCGGTYVENDWEYSLQGDVLMIADEDVLVQSALKLILTRIRSNPYHPAYGTSIMESIGTKAVATTAGNLSVQVREGLRSMMNSQALQSKFQQVTQKERMLSVNTVNVTQSKDDPTVFLVDVTVTNASGEPVAVSVVYTAPGAVALTGSNGLSLGTQAVGLR